MSVICQHMAAQKQLRVMSEVTVIQSTPVLALYQ